MTQTLRTSGVSGEAERNDPRPAGRGRGAPGCVRIPPPTTAPALTVEVLLDSSRLRQQINAEVLAAMGRVRLGPGFKPLADRAGCSVGLVNRLTRDPGKWDIEDLAPLAELEPDGVGLMVRLATLFLHVGRDVAARRDPGRGQVVSELIARANEVGRAPSQGGAR